jgi:CheY-like chemotaxis protein
MIKRLWKQIFPASLKTEEPKNPCDEKDLFFAGISHEIRTPVNGIAGFTQLLKETELSEEQDELVDTIHSSSMHLLELVNAILDFSKINSNSLALEQVSFNLFRQIEDTVDTHALMASQKDVEVGLYIDPTISPMLLGDPIKISQVIINLVGNAIKFTDSFGRVNVTIEQMKETAETSTLKFSVSDTGIGIDSTQQEHIFNPFSQATPSISKKFGGTGLGLAISSKLVALMGGTLQVVSELEVGSIFYFTLTLDKADTSEVTRYVNQFTGLRVGLLLPNREVDREIDYYLQRYLRYLGTDFDILFGEEILSESHPPLPDILFVDQRYTRRVNELNQVLALDTKIILMTTATIKKEYQFDASNVDRIVYKPMNLTKVIRALTSSTKPPEVERNESDREQFSGLHVLVAEDNQVNQKLMERILEKLDVTVSIANNGEKALSLYKRDAFDMIFMDIQMPVMDGVEASQSIIAYEQDKVLSHVPIIALTGNITTKDRAYYLDAGMDACIAKPIDVKEIIQLIKEYSLLKNIVKSSAVENVKGYDYKGVRALIVEDNTINQKLIERVLVSLGIEADIASNGSIAVKRYQEEQFDIIFMGTEMPVLGGIAATEKICSYEKKNFLEHTPIIALLPDGMPDEEKKRYTEAGVDNYIHKPLDIDEIKFQVERYLKHRQVPREHLSAVLSEVSIDEEADSFPLCDIALEEQSNTPIEGQDSENTDIEHSPVSPMTDEEEVTEAKRSKEEKREEKNFVEEVAVEQDSKEEVLIVEQTVPQYEIKYIDIPLNSKSRNRNT